MSTNIDSTIHNKRLASWRQSSNASCGGGQEGQRGLTDAVPPPLGQQHEEGKGR